MATFAGYTTSCSIFHPKKKQSKSGHPGELLELTEADIELLEHELATVAIAQTENHRPRTPKP
jgi:hypothetical protein